jgi:hypothetical protein
MRDRQAWQASLIVFSALHPFLVTMRQILSRFDPRDPRATSGQPTMSGPDAFGAIQ